MRTVEVLIVIIIIIGAFVFASFYAVLPMPRRVSPMNLKRLASTTLQVLDSDHNLSSVIFKPREDSDWVKLQVALSTLLPPNIVYNFTVYNVQTESEGTIYVSYKSFSNTESLGIQSEATSYLVASSNATFKVIPEKIGEHWGGGTLYILNCSDANGWWITGYTASSLAEDLYRLLSPYFQKTLMVQNTAELAKILNGQPLQGETVQNAVVINTFGEAVPIPTEYCQGHERESEGYYASAAYPYTRYCYTLGQKTRQYNWTWVSIVGYPLYYVSNLEVFAENHNTYGIYGMMKVYQGGIIAFLQGLDGQPYVYNDAGITGSSTTPVNLLPETIEHCDYYGIYPSPSQTSTRALSASILNSYNLTIGIELFNRFNNYIPGAVYQHIFKGTSTITGSLFALGLTRTPDIRLTALGLLSYYKPRLYRSEFSAAGNSRLVVLQLGIMGGV